MVILRSLFLLILFSSFSHAATLPGSLWTSDRVSEPLIGIAVAPTVDSSWQSIITLGQETLSIYRYSDEKSSKVLEYKKNSGEEWIKLTTFDVDQDGLDEAIISGFYHERVVSKVVSFKEGRAQVLLEMPYYVTRYQWGDRSILAAQKRHGNDDFSGHIYEIKISGSDYALGQDLNIVKGLRIQVPPLYSIQAFQTGYLYLDSVGTLHYYEGTPFAKRWSSSQNYGGHAFYLDRQVKGILNDLQKERFFVPLSFRPLEAYPVLNARTFNPDATCPDPTVSCVPAPQSHVLTKKYEEPSADQKAVYLVKNEGYLNNVIGAVPSVKSSQIIKLAWTGFGFQEVWSSPRYDGAITDLALVDWDGDKKEEIAFTLLLRDRGYADTLKKQDSLIVVVKPTL